MHEYLFDVKLFAAIRVRAKSEAAARKLIGEHVNGSLANVGSWPNGDPILFEVHQDDGENDDLIEIDGEAV